MGPKRAATLDELTEGEAAGKGAELSTAAAQSTGVAKRSAVREDTPRA
jgi:hypothetical protein